MLRQRCSVSIFSNLCEAAPRSLFSAPNGFNELPNVARFEFPFILIGKSIMAFLNTKARYKSIMARAQTLVHRRGPKIRIFSTVSQTHLARVLFPK